MNRNYTIRELEQIEGWYPNEGETKKDLDRLAIPRWYEGIRDKRISDLTAFDICRIIRHGYFFDFIIPEAINRLQKDPFFGSISPYELVKAIHYNTAEFWITHYKLARKLRTILESIQTRHCFCELFRTNTRLCERNFQIIDG